MFVMPNTIALYLRVSSASCCQHLGWTPTRVLGTPRLPIAPEGSSEAACVDGWSFTLDTLALAESAFQTVDILFYLGNCCIHNLFASTICEVCASGRPDSTLGSDFAIRLVAWFVAQYGQRYSKDINVTPAVHVQMKPVERLRR